MALCSLPQDWHRAHAAAARPGHAAHPRRLRAASPARLPCGEVPARPQLPGGEAGADDGEPSGEMTDSASSSALHACLRLLGPLPTAWNEPDPPSYRLPNMLNPCRSGWRWRDSLERCRRRWASCRRRWRRRTSKSRPLSRTCPPPTSTQACVEGGLRVGRGSRGGQPGGLAQEARLAMKPHGPTLMSVSPPSLLLEQLELRTREDQLLQVRAGAGVVAGFRLSGGLSLAGRHRRVQDGKHSSKVRRQVQGTVAINETWNRCTSCRCAPGWTRLRRSCWRRRRRCRSARPSAAAWACSWRRCGR